VGGWGVAQGWKISSGGQGPRSSILPLAVMHHAGVTTDPIRRAKQPHFPFDPSDLPSDHPSDHPSDSSWASAEKSGPPALRPPFGYLFPFISPTTSCSLSLSLSLSSAPALACLSTSLSSRLRRVPPRSLLTLGVFRGVEGQAPPTTLTSRRRQSTGARPALGFPAAETS
jgi:hypothetical protein